MTFQERRKKGDRWFLALVDPLLNKPAYFALRKPQVSVGFLPGCDWTLPWSSMGIDVVADSGRNDASYNRRLHSSWPFHRTLGQRLESPQFELTFVKEEGGPGCWNVSCPPGHDCRVGSIGDGDMFWSERENPNVTTPNPESKVDSLQDGEVFEFVWPYYHYDSGDGNYLFDMPPQRLRFVFIEELIDEPEPVPADPTSTTVVSSVKLTTLPVEVLARIASHLSPSEYLDTLALVGRIFTSPRLKGAIPWPFLTLENSFDALRVPEMASPEAVREVRCQRPWDERQRYAVYLKWRPIIAQENLRELEITDQQLVCVAGVPPKLEELRMYIDDNLRGFWASLECVTFPPTVTRVIISCGDGCFERPEDDFCDLFFSPGEPAVPDADCMSPKWLFRSFSNLQKLHLKRVPCLDTEWDDVADEKYEKITHLVVATVDPEFPLAKMKNLVVLQVCLDSSVNLRTLGLPEGSWDTLESLTVKAMTNSRQEDDQAMSALEDILQKAPNLRYLKLSSKLFNESMCESLTSWCPQLRFLWLRRAAVNLDSMARMLSNHENLGDVTIVDGLGSNVDDMPREAFPVGPGVTARWQWWKSGTGEYHYNFYFSRCSDEDLQQLMDKYQYVRFE